MKGDRANTTKPQRRCAFCPNEAITLTREHLWSAWIGDLVKSKAYNFRLYTEAGTVKTWKQKQLDQSARVVCGDCNNGWMSELEAEVKTGFRDVIIYGSALSLLPSALTLLAAFSFKCAVIADQIRPPDDAFFYTSHTRNRFRTTRRIPDGVQMWLGAFAGKYRSSGRFEGHYLSTGTTFTPFDHVQFHVFTYLAGHLVLQVVAPKWADVRRSGLPLPVISQERIWDTSAVQFWPLNGQPISFPPRHYLSPATIDRFVNRFVGIATGTF